MEENIEYQQVASTIEKVYTKAASTKMSLPNIQVPLRKFLPNHSRTFPFSGQCSSYESPEQQY